MPTLLLIFCSFCIIVSKFHYKYLYSLHFLTHKNSLLGPSSFLQSFVKSFLNSFLNLFAQVLLPSSFLKSFAQLLHSPYLVTFVAAQHGQLWANMIGITDIENLYNSYMAALFQDGEIKDSGIYLSESKIILCSIQLHINLSKEKVCKTSDKPTSHQSITCTSANP